MKPNLITPKEAAAILKLAPTTLANWRQSGSYNLPYVKSGRRVFYDEADVYAFIQSRKQMHTSLQAA